ncbi:MAG: mechanosensitive ion channel family protein [Myxococcota bacterium]
MSAQEAVESLVGKLSGWAEGLVAMLPNLLVAILVVFLFGLLARLAAGITDRSLRRVSDNTQARSLLKALVRGGVVLVGVFVALGVLQLDGTVTSLLAGVGVVGLALGFAFQDIAANFVAGVLLALRQPFKIDEVIEVDDLFLTVEDMNLRATLGRTFDGVQVIIPNKDLFTSVIKNYGRSPHRRIDVGVGVSYGDDLERAEKLAIEAITAYDERDKERDVELYWQEFGDSSVNFSVRFWILSAEHSPLTAKSDAIKLIKKRFDEEGVTIPFPIRTMDFGPVGGTRLDEVLPAALGDGEAGSPRPATERPGA